jgi:hypothetical protein
MNSFSQSMIASRFSLKSSGSMFYLPNFRVTTPLCRCVQLSCEPGYMYDHTIIMTSTLLCSHELSGYIQFISLFIFSGRIRICITFVLLDSVVPVIAAYRFCYQYMCYSDMNRFNRRLTIQINNVGLIPFSNSQAKYGMVLLTL